MRHSFHRPETWRKIFLSDHDVPYQGYIEYPDYSINLGSLFKCCARPDTWRETLGTDEEAERSQRLETYSGYLDTVETHLLQEIAARSDNFFEAAGYVQVGRCCIVHMDIILFARVRATESVSWNVVTG